MEVESIQRQNPHHELQQAFDQYNHLSSTLEQSYSLLSDLSSSLTSQNESQKQLQRHHQLLDAIPGCVIVLDPHGRVADYNQPALELLKSPLKDENWRDVVSRGFLSQLDQGELQTSDGRQFSISTKPLGYEPGQILLLSEVTQTRQLQRAAQQNLHLITMGKMMASLAHQIRTPLASSMLYLSQIIEVGLEGAKSLKFCGKALDRIRHIETMINDMLVFAHGGQFNTNDFTISQLLNDLDDQIRPHVRQVLGQFEITEIVQNLAIKGNQHALLGALANLCMNAIDARKDILHIRVDVGLTSKGQLQINISDNGKGMSADTLQHLFDPFFTTKIDGTGLGLAVVKSVIESHQGQISVTSQGNVGSCFSILLPCQQASRTQLSQSKSNKTAEVKK